MTNLPTVQEQLDITPPKPTAVSRILLELKDEGYTPAILDCLSRRDEKRFKVLLSAMQDERYNHLPWGKLCRMSGVDLSELEQIWIDFNKQKGYLKVASKLPEIMDDVATDALSRVSICTNCEGVGRLLDKPENPICTICEGSGKVRKQGCIKSREMIFDAMKVTSKEPLISINQNFSLERLVGETSKLMKEVETIDV